ncbi:hypothetical protein J3B02_001388 [Coemansia erecta]|nr:hypothetical protein J3B02_001388 [Coemansia erecta]
MMSNMIYRNIVSGSVALSRTRLIAATVSASRAHLSTTAGTFAPIQQNNHHNNSTASSDHLMSPHELLEKMHPKRHGEILSSMLDGEQDYDTDMGAASVNNIAAERRAEARKRAAEVSKMAGDYASEKTTEASKMAADYGKKAGDYASEKTAEASNMATEAKNKAAEAGKKAGDYASEKTAEASKKAENIARDTYDDLSKRRF